MSFWTSWIWSISMNSDVRHFSFWSNDFEHLSSLEDTIQKRSARCHKILWKFGCSVSVAVNLNTLQWRNNERDGVSNHQHYDCLLNRLFRRRWKKISKLRVTGLCEGNSPVSGEFPAQRASNAEYVSIWWRHHDLHTRDHPYTIAFFTCVTISKVRQLFRFHNVLICCSISHTCDHIYMLAVENHPPDIPCRIMAVFVGAFIVAQNFVVSFISVNSFYMVVMEKKFNLGKYDLRLLIPAFGMPLILCSIFAIVKVFGPSGGWWVLYLFTLWVACNFLCFSN